MIKAPLPFYSSCYYFVLVAVTPKDKKKTSNLIIVGDLMQHQGQIDAARTPSGLRLFSFCFKLVKDEIDSADIVIGNLEVTLGGKPTKVIRSSVPG